MNFLLFLSSLWNLGIYYLKSNFLLTQSLTCKRHFMDDFLQKLLLKSLLEQKQYAVVQEMFVIIKPHSIGLGICNSTSLNNLTSLNADTLRELKNVSRRWSYYSETHIWGHFLSRFQAAQAKLVPRLLSQHKIYTFSSWSNHW